MTTRRFTDNSTQTRLEAALERLNISETTLPNTIPYRDLIPGIARQLTIMRRKDDRPSPPLAAQLKPVVWDGTTVIDKAAPGQGWEIRRPWADD